jgi:hypothetical protein
VSSTYYGVNFYNGFLRTTERNACDLLYLKNIEEVQFLKTVEAVLLIGSIFGSV